MFFDRLKKRATSIVGTEYETRLAANSRFYAYVREKMKAIDYPEEEA